MSTKVVVIVTFFMLIIFGVLYDMYLINNGSQTISQAIYEICCDYPIIAFLVGILVGHFFWPQFMKE